MPGLCKVSSRQIGPWKRPQNVVLKVKKAKELFEGLSVKISSFVLFWGAWVGNQTQDLTQARQGSYFEPHF